MVLACTISEIDGDFSQKPQNFPTPFVFCAPAEGVPLELGTGDGSQKTRRMGLPDLTKTFDNIFSHLDTIHQRDRRTDGQTDTE